MSGVPVSGLGTKLTIGETVHSIRFPTRSIIAIEEAFGGIEECMQSFKTVTTKSNFMVLSHAEIDGEYWDEDRLDAALENVPQITLAMDLGKILMDKMSYGHPMSEEAVAATDSAASGSPKEQAGSTGPA